MDSFTSNNDNLISNLEAGRTQVTFEQRQMMGTAFDDLNNNVPSVTESRLDSRALLKQQLNNQNIDQSNIVALTKSSSSCQITTIKSTPNEQKQRGKQFNCEHCKASFYTHNALRMHIEVFHKSKSETVNSKTNANQCETSNALFKCCEIVFHTVKEVRIHMYSCTSVHNSMPNGIKVSNSCKMSGIVSKLTQNDQTEHPIKELTKSTNKSSFNCFNCNKSFSNKASLATHRWCAHSKHLVYHCKVNGCDKKFITKTHLSRHYTRNVHQGVNYPCGQCKMLGNRNNLWMIRYHLRNHHQIEFDRPPINQPPVKCHKCGKSYKNQQSLTIHNWNTHGSNRLYLCEVSGCGKKLNTSSGRVRHYREVHKGVNFPCDQCKMVRNRKDSVVDHLRTCHQIHVLDYHVDGLNSEDREDSDVISLATQKTDLEDLGTHILDVHVYGLNSEKRKNFCERSIETEKADEHSIEQVNLIEPMNQDEKLLDKIVIDEQSSHISHDHIYHQTDHFPTRPLNANESLRCAFAECGDLTFNHSPSLLRHTRLKHPESLHPILLKPFRNSRRPRPSNHVLKIVLTSKIKCSLCEKWFQRQDCLEVHVMQEHMVEIVVIGGFGECNEELERNCGMHQEPVSQPITNKRNCLDKKFRTNKDIYNHYSSTVHKGFSLPLDQNKCLRNRKDLMLHLRTNHNINLDQPQFNSSQSIAN